MSKLLFVINPISGDRDKTPIISSIDSWAKSSSHEVEKWETTGGNDHEKLEERIENWNADVVISVGGDGTVMLCAHVLKGSERALGIIPGGSANGMATELQIPDDVEEALNIIAAGKTINADMLCFNREHFGLHISDVGLNAGLVKDYENGERRGFLGYASGVISQLMNLERFKAKITLDKEVVIEEEVLMIAFANAQKYGTGAVLSANGKIDDGRFELYVLRRMDIAGLAGQFFEFFNEESDYCQVHHAKHVLVELDRPIPFQIDGELKADSSSIEVEILPACLKMIVP